jgi:GT2 family glycosyltransferase
MSALAADDLSVIIVNWNTRQMLRDCLLSVFRELGDDKADVIVIDNASNDGSAEMVGEDFPQVTLLLNGKNRGFAAANNQGLRIATGRYVLLLNSDTIVHGKVLQSSVEYLERNPNVGAMGCRVLNFDGTTQATGSRFPSILNLILLTSGLWRVPVVPFFDRYQMRRWDRHDERELDVISGCFLMARANAVEQVGLLDEDFFFFGEETDWCLRFRQAGWSLRLAPVGTITHFGGGSSGPLNHNRDILLSNALVKLHKKHRGMASAAIVWLILLVFNATRALYWIMLSLPGLSPRAAARRDHFLRVLKGFPGAWSSVDPS